MPAGGLRGQVHMVTGTGETVTAAVAALRPCPNGVIGVLLPTLDLLTQTIEAWRQVGYNGWAAAVCPLGADPPLETLGVRCTTHPTQLALWADVGPMLVFAKYASLASQGLFDDQDTDTLGTPQHPGARLHIREGTKADRLAPSEK
ncbi:hypothetical protein AB0M42_07835 [Streptomyces sp. NPDC051784]|uniref:hypothetical protein n=1 Tax=Streptomyces sp. NPDC051784 TaxID=3155805 RepID=UPI003438FBCD